MPFRRTERALRATNGTTFRRARLEALEERRLLALVPELVADVNTVNYGSNAVPRIVSEDALYFTADAPVNALFRTDGSPDGTMRLTPNDVVVLPHQPVIRTQGSVYFTGRELGLNYEVRLWRYDESERTVDPLGLPLPGPREPGALGVVDGRLLYQRVAEGSNDVELWSVDPTRASEARLGTFADGIGINRPAPLVVGQEMLFLAKQTQGGETALWRTDGTSAGTYQVLSEGKEVFAAFGANLVVYEDQVYFVGAQVGVATEIWRYDGTLHQHTSLVTEGYSVVDAVLHVAGNQVYVSVTKNGGPSWDMLAIDVNAPTFHYTAPYLRAKLLNYVNGNLIAIQPTSFMSEWHIYVLDVVSSEWVPLVSGTVTDDFAHTATSLVFVKDYELWISDGTVAGTHKAFGAPFDSPPENPAIVRDRVVFRRELLDIGSEPFTWELGTASPELLIDANTSTRNSEPFQITPVGDSLYFLAFDNQSLGYALWRTDLRNGETMRVSQFSPRILEDCGRLATFHPDAFLQAVGDDLYYLASFGKELWKTDGTPEGTHLVKVFDAIPDRMDSIDNKLLIVVEDQLYGNELWVSDGTEQGTHVLVDIATGDWSSNPSNFVYIDDKLLFHAKSDDGKTRLWRTDGTAEGTVPISGPLAYNLFAAMVGDRVFYTEATEQGNERWSTDGTHAAPLRPEFPPGEDISSFSIVGAAHGAIFIAAGAEGNVRLWKTEDHGATVQLIAGIPTLGGPGGSFIVGNALVFSTSAGFYRTDGAASGTYLLSTFLASDNGYFQSQRYFDLSGQVVFNRVGEFWRTDGTTDGTYPITSQLLSSNGSKQKPSYLVYEGQLFASFWTSEYGMELHRLVSFPGDTNFDGQVDIVDLNNVRNNFGATGNVLGDANGDGSVDIHDLNAVRNNFGAGGSSPASAESNRRPGDDLPPQAVAAVAREGAVSAATDNWQDALFRAQAEAWFASDASQPGRQARRLKAVDRWFARL